VDVKPRKAHKRLSKLDELLSDLAKGYSKGALHVHAAIEGAKVAVSHLKNAVNTPTSPAAKKAEAPSTDAPKPAKRKLSAAHKRAIQEGARRRAAAKKAAAIPDATVKKTAPAPKKKAAKKAK
jgi:hypothetical protein